MKKEKKRKDRKKETVKLRTEGMKEKKTERKWKRTEGRKERR